MNEHREQEEEEPDAHVRAVDAEPRLRDDEPDHGLGKRVQAEGPGRVQILHKPDREPGDDAGDGAPDPAEIDDERDEKIRVDARDGDAVGHRRLEDEHDDEHDRVPQASHGAITGGATTGGATTGTGPCGMLSGAVDSRAGMLGPRPAPAGM